MPDFFVDRQQNFIWTGFDSAWKGVNPGAIAWMTGSSNELVFHHPKEATFEDCIQFIDSKTLQSDMHLLMIDHPTIVRNDNGFRPVESVVAHKMGRAGSAVQPANRNKKDMFGEHAPIWVFLAKLKERGFQEVTANSFSAKQGRYYLETYPAFGDLGLFGYKKCPKYNPAGKTFSLSDWKKLCLHIGQVGMELKIEGLKRWAEKMCRDADKKKTLLKWKKDQDLLDAVLCMLFGYVWWRSGLEQSTIIGDDKKGYMVVPCLRKELRTQLNDDAIKHGVPVDTFFPKNSTVPAEQNNNQEEAEQVNNPLPENKKVHSRLSKAEQQEILDSPPLDFHISSEPLSPDPDQPEENVIDDSKKGFWAKLFKKIFG